jgi:Putative Actinobacterial Holin-X, holin superfamily III
MRNDIVGLAQQYARQRVQIAAKRIAIPTAFGVVAAIFFLIVLISLFAALFYWLASLYGPVTAALIVAAVALVLGLIALLLVFVGRRPPPPAPISTTPQVAALLAQTAPLALKRPLLTAVLLAVALGVLARGASSDRK